MLDQKGLKNKNTGRSDITSPATTSNEEKLLTLYREMSEQDRLYILLVAEALALN